MMAFHYLLGLLVLFDIGCTSKPPEKAMESAPDVALPKVTDDRNDLVLSWFADGGSPVASSVKEVPAEARREVRVQDPSIPPEKRDPEVMFIADLRTPNKDGTYQVKAVRRADWEAKRRAALEAARKKAAAAQAAVAPPAQIPPQIPTVPGGTAPVIMYATKHCPVCIKARRWLLENAIPYTEYDIEKDADAARRLQAKGAAQNVPTSGVPLFEIGGRLIPGFDPAVIAKMLTLSASP